VRGYFAGAQHAAFLPRDRQETALLVDRFLFEKTLGSLGSRLASGPASVDQLLRTLLEMLDVDPARMSPA
jgi:hypothetical protein